MADERVAYLDSSRHSEQLSCTKFFHPSYGLFYINFQSFSLFLKFLDLLLIRNLNRNSKCTQGLPSLVYDSGVRGVWLTVDQVND